jgi:prephenate dehydrogenase
MNVFVIGVGLIGGSMALDIKAKNRNVIIFGIDKNKEHLQQAIDLHLIDEAAELDDISVADIVIIAVPVDATLLLLPKILDRISSDTLVFDVGSTKSFICESVTNHPKRSNFLATHPITGTEFSGPSAAEKELFKGKTNIICEVEKTSFHFQVKAKKLFEDMGMKIIYMEPDAHDKHIAYCSHLSHICSFMLGKTVIEKEKDERGIFDLAGSGFASTVRLAKSSPSMWTPIFMQNKENVIDSLEEFIQNLTHFKDALITDNHQELFNEMKGVNRIREILKGIDKQ